MAEVEKARTPEAGPAPFDSGVPEMGQARAEYLVSLIKSRGLKEGDQIFVIADFGGVFSSQQLDFRGVNWPLLRVASPGHSVVGSIDLRTTPIISIEILNNEKRHTPITSSEFLYGTRYLRSVFDVPPVGTETTFAISKVNAKGEVSNNYIEGKLVAIGKDSVTIIIANNKFGSLDIIGKAQRILGKPVTFSFVPPPAGKGGIYVRSQQDWHERPAPQLSKEAEEKVDSWFKEIY